MKINNFMITLRLVLLFKDEHHTKGDRMKKIIVSLFIAALSNTVITKVADAQTIICTPDGNKISAKRTIKNPLVCDGMDLQVALRTPACFRGMGGVSWQKAALTDVIVSTEGDQLRVNGLSLKTRGTYTPEQQRDLLRVALDISKNVGPSGRLLFSLLSTPTIKDTEACRQFDQKTLWSSASSSLRPAPDWIMMALARTDLAAAAAFGTILREKANKINRDLRALKAAVDRCDDEQTCYAADQSALVQRFGVCIAKHGKQSCMARVALAIKMAQASLLSGLTTHVTTSRNVAFSAGGRLHGRRLQFKLLRKGRWGLANRVLRFAKMAAKAADFAGTFDGEVVSDLLDIADLVADLLPSRRKALREAIHKSSRRNRPHRCDLFIFPKEGTTAEQKTTILSKAAWFVNSCVE